MSVEIEVVGLPLFPRNGVLQHAQQDPDVSIVAIKFLLFDLEGYFSLQLGRDLKPHSIELYLSK
jgi:hypothetical protein